MVPLKFTGSTGAITMIGNTTITGNLTITGEFENSSSEINIVNDAFLKLNTGNGEADAGVIVETSDTDDARLFYDVSAKEDQLVVRSRTEYDNVTPSGGSIALALLIKMQNLTGKNKYENIIISILRTNTSLKLEHSLSFGYFLSSLHMFMEKPGKARKTTENQ